MNFQRDALASELIDYRKNLDGATVLSAVENKIDRPNVIRTFRLAASDAAGDRPESSFLLLLHGHFKPFAFPESVDSFEVHCPAFLAEQSCDQAIAVAGKLADKLQNPSHQPWLVVFNARFIALAAAWLADRLTSPTLRDAAGLHDVADSRASASRA